MALDFPSNPIDGEVFDAYVWSAAKGVWQAREESAAVAVMSPTTPTSATPGDIWVNTAEGTSFVYYDDGSTSQWVELISSREIDISGKANLAGGNTFSGIQTFSTPISVSSGGTGAGTLAASGYLKGNGTSAITSQTGIPAEDITSGILSIARGGTGMATGAGLVSMVPSSVSVSSGSASISSNGTVTFAGVGSLSLNNVFSSSYKNYRLIVEASVVTTTGIGIRYRTGTTDNSSNLYYQYWTMKRVNGTTQDNTGGPATAYNLISATSGTTWMSWSGDIFNPFNSAMRTVANGLGYGNDATSSYAVTSAILYDQTTSFDGISLLTNGFSGTVKIYGYN